MTLNEFDFFLNSFLKKENFLQDPSLNGIQIENSSPNKKQIKKVAFAVDACELTAKKAAEQNADVLVVHHGLYWGHCERARGIVYKRLSSFIKADLALIAYHLPLDANDPYGNNFGLANMLNMKNLSPFGKWRGMEIGVKGELAESTDINSFAQKIGSFTHTKCRVFDFGKKEIKSVGIISGGAGNDFVQAVEQNLDLFVTGEFMHENFHPAKESCMNVISGGHYGTEIIGVSLLQKKVEQELGLETVFIDFPTGL